MYAPLKQPGFTYSACNLLIAKKEFKNFKEQEIQEMRNELDKACFQQDMAQGEFKDSLTRTVSDKVLYDKGLILLNI